MLELNKWFFVQLANFIVLLILLNYVLFRPLLRLFNERNARTKGFLDEAKAMDREREVLSKQVDMKLSETRNQAKAVFEKLGAEGVSLQKNSLKSAAEQAAEITGRARRNLEAEAVKTRELLKMEVKIFSDKIVEKMIGV